MQRPLINFEEAEEERAAAEAAVERAAAERAAAERAAAVEAAAVDATAEQAQAGQLPDPVCNTTQDTVIEVPATQNSDRQVPATQEPGIRVQVTQTRGTQRETSRPQGLAVNPPTTTGGNDPNVLRRLDRMENTLRALVALNRRQAPTMPNFRCPQLAPMCGLEVPVEPRHNFETVGNEAPSSCWGRWS